MSVLMSNPYHKYKQSAVETAPPDKLLLMLYDGAIKFLLQAQQSMEKRDYEASHRLNLRVQEIILELNTTLDMSYGEIPQRLRSLYNFYYQQLILANIKKDPKMMEPVLSFLQEYRILWEEAMRLSKSGVINE